jgi:thiol-disulfide isomerase/thioredoxin
MSYNKEVDNMKYLNIILLLISFNVSAQEWISDDNFDSKINEKQAFGDDQNKPVIVEFYAKFNDANKFEQWSELKDVIYYRADIATCPTAKKKYKVRMAPTLIIFKDGIKETVFKAGLDLMLPVDLNEIQEAVDEVNTASQF